jgi:F-type H+-transporting ATPase subunit b
MEALGINLGLLVVQVIAFTIVFLALQAWIYKPMLNMMQTRKQKIAQGLEDARVAAEARADAEKEGARIVAEAHAEASRIVQDATERAAGAARDVKTAAEAEALAARETILAEAQQERNRVLGDLRGQIGALAVAATQKLISATLDEKRQHALIDEFFSGTTRGRVMVLEDVAAKGESAEVTSALPLNADEQEIVKKELLSKVSAHAVTFHVDPTILGGLVVKVGDKVLDGSIAAQLGELGQSLK